MESKRCVVCTKVKEISEFYSQKKIKKDIGEWIYYFPECKKCTIERSGKRQRDNREEKKVYDRIKYLKKEGYYKKKAIEWKVENRERYNEYYKNWQNENKDKMKEYRIRRESHKKHDISKEDLTLLYKYCDSSCMYCGITEEESLVKYNQKLHKDHANNFGSDGIENCVLACRNCNSSKHKKDWDEWFTVSEHYNEERYAVISHWLEIWK